MKTLVVDDHKLISNYLVHYLKDHFPDHQVTEVKCFSNNMVQTIVSKKPDLVILDISLNTANTMDFFVDLKIRLPKTFFVIYTMHNIPSYKNFFFLNGANAYVLKEDAQLELKEVILKVIKGLRIFPENEEIVDINYRLNQLTFTEKEKEILAVLIETINTEEIVKKLGCTEIDVLNMRRKLLDKTGAENTQQLVNYTIDYNWTK